MLWKIFRSSLFLSTLIVEVIQPSERLFHFTSTKTAFFAFLHSRFVLLMRVVFNPAYKKTFYGAFKIKKEYYFVINAE
jgi:hypothetical protein